jgi:hypothetical protein
MSRSTSLPTLTMSRSKSLPRRVSEAGGIRAWNAQAGLYITADRLTRTCTASTVDEALAEVQSLMSFDHLIFAYAYMRALYDKVRCPPPRCSSARGRH